MAEMTLRSEAAIGSAHERPGDPCVMVIFGASGDLTKRLLMPAIYNLACDGLLPHNVALVGTARDDMTHEFFRDQMSTDIRLFTTRDFDESVWDEFVQHLYYVPGSFDDPATYQRLAQSLSEVDAKHQTRGNRLFYLAVPPAVFSLIARQLGLAGLAREEKSWSRLVVEKPFGHDFESAVTLNRELQEQWQEHQIWRIDH
jgi:glucose-6-phosphate 1-dehydrogenase